MSNKNLSNKKTQWMIVLCTLIAAVAISIPLQAEDPTESIHALRNIGKAFTSIAEQASPAVVSIRVEKTVSQRAQGQFNSQHRPLDEDGLRRFFGPRNQTPPWDRQDSRRRDHAQGTGFLVSEDGYILTNNHLVGASEDEAVIKVVVTLADGQELEAEVIGTDPDTDVAVVKIEGHDYDVIELADSDALEVGEWVVAIGNPFGFDHTVTSGIVSAKRRNVDLTHYDNFIQTDAAINPGNSGGPLLNLDGEAVGINTAIYGPMGNIGIGLAIPINMAKNIYDQLVSTGEVARGYLGVYPQDVDHAMARKLKLDEVKGTVISEVSANSAADRAGFKVYDVVIELNGASVENAQDFRHKVAGIKPGEEVELEVVRQGRKRTLSATLDRQPGHTESVHEKRTEENHLGIVIGNLTEKLAEQHGLEDSEGVLIVDVKPGSDAERKGLRPGMLIIEADFEPVKTVQQLNRVLTEAQKDGQVTFRVATGRAKRIVTVKFDN